MEDVVNIRTLRANLAAAINEAEHGHITTVTRDGQPVAALVPLAMLETLDELEDRILNRMADEAEKNYDPNAPKFGLVDMFAEITRGEP
jgi:prevent-host-death family protein